MRTARRTAVWVLGILGAACGGAQGLNGHNILLDPQSWTADLDAFVGQVRR